MMNADQSDARESERVGQPEFLRDALALRECDFQIEMAGAERIRNAMLRAVVFELMLVVVAPRAE